MTPGSAAHPVSYGRRIPAMREALRLAIVREGAGLSVLEQVAAKPGEDALAAQAVIAAEAAKRDIAALRDCLSLLEFLETGGSL